MKKILITGAHGFIGRNLVHYLSGRYEVYDPPHHQLDLLDSQSVERYLRQHAFDFIVHTAVQGTLGMPQESACACQLRNNLLMFYHLKRCSDAYGKMYYYGSGAEYGNDAYKPLMKETYFGTVVPEDDYGLSKYLMAEGISEDGNIYNLRLFGVFGPYENYNYRFISNAICKALCERPIRIRYNRCMDYLYITDLCKITEWFLEHEPKYCQYNVCTSHGVEILYAAQMVVKAAESRSAIIVEQSGLGREYTGDNSRLLAEMGGFSFTPFSEAIQELVQYYRSIDFLLEGDY